VDPVLLIVGAVLSIPATWITARRGVLWGLLAAVATFLTVCGLVAAWGFGEALLEPPSDPEQSRFGGARTALVMTMLMMVLNWAPLQAIGVLAASLFRWTWRSARSASAPAHGDGTP
jgi:hypothetical protein